MKGDFTRNTFDPKKRYTSVRLQQGRVLLDADWNEQVDIRDHLDRLAHRDLIGASGAPQDSPGFALSWDGEKRDLNIGAGRFYVDGILVENDARALFTDQPYLPEAELPTENGIYIFYLDVRERHVTALEDEELREIALGGPDTTTRTQLVWQVKWLQAEEGEEPTCKEALDLVRGKQRSTAQLAARAEPADMPATPCEVPEKAGYRGLENQLYRVEIHEGSGPGKPTFKWSRENGSIVTKWVGQDGSRLTVETVGRDDVLRFNPGDWVELTDDNRELRGESGILVRIERVEGNVLIIANSTDVDIVDFPEKPKIRRWDSAGAQEVETNTWIELENGIQIKFTDANFRTGDYWTIPARTAVRDVLWPKSDNQPASLPPEGIEHHYAVLAIGRLENAQWSLGDCRQIFPPLTELPAGGRRCCMVTVGDGVHSTGDFQNLQKAIQAHPQQQGLIICLLPGEHRLKEPVVIERSYLHIQGCGSQSRIISPSGRTVLEIERSRDVLLDNLFIVACTKDEKDAAVRIMQCQDIEVRNCSILNMRSKRAWEFAAAFTPAKETPCGMALEVHESIGIRLLDSEFFGLPAISLQAADAKIRGNHIVGGSAWVRDGSSDIAIEGNEIHHGKGAGISLGGLAEGEAFSNQAVGVTRASIVHNHIHNMDNSGIATLFQLEKNLELGELEEITIAHNRIHSCGIKGVGDEYDPVAVGGIVLRNVTALRIHDNLVTDNGANGPAVGIFVYQCPGLEVSHNRLLGNGSPTVNKDGYRGFQAGLVVWGAFGGELRTDAYDSGYHRDTPAAVITDNVISTPKGQALFLIGAGGMQIRGNNLVSGGIYVQPSLLGDEKNIWEQAGRCVTVVNLGLGRDRNPDVGMSSPDKQYMAMQSQWPDGLVCFQSNQVRLETDKTDEWKMVGNRMLIFGTAIVSFDDVLIGQNRIMALVPMENARDTATRRRVLINLISLVSTLRITDNRFIEYHRDGWILSAFCQGNFLSITGNQATHCVTGEGLNLVERDNQVMIETLSRDVQKESVSDLKELFDGFSQWKGHVWSDGLGMLAALQNRRAEKVDHVAKRMESVLGEGHPKIRALKNVRSRAMKMQEFALKEIARSKGS
ncbi:MAG TPA: hypothetical protein ENI90_09500 [Methylothermaceae bacterium]|nr:hypothetical protein [Methylothermaceae bacterium]